MAAYQIILDRLPEHVPSLGGLGWLLHVTGEREAALTLYQKCAALEKGNLESWFEETYLKGLITTRTCPFPLRRRQRHANLLQVFNTTCRLRGDVVECGCFQGLSSFLLCSALTQWEPDFLGEEFHIFDSFAGLSRPGIQDAEPIGRSTPMCKEGFFGASLDLVRNNLADFPKVNYHPGWIPESLVGLPELSYRFVHVDVDLYAPTLASFQYFFPRLVPDGIILTDDYNWPGARQAVEEFANDVGVDYQLTANDQAYFIRPH
ncbi:MAG TPA: TylF/MycF/NovP-related O-methyltransferase [Methylococcaceae bacterium]|nr:TylF/MycF/NovP-related O-methyltransferase [Methylococcaceae bacterium]